VGFEEDDVGFEEDEEDAEDVEAVIANSLVQRYVETAKAAATASGNQEVVTYFDVMGGLALARAARRECGTGYGEHVTTCSAITKEPVFLFVVA
jgi:hypothetical protein